MEEQPYTARLKAAEQGCNRFNDKRIKTKMDGWKKYKCVYCGYELASKAKSPRCTKPGCRSTRLNEIAQFSPLIKKSEVKNMAEEKELPKQKQREELDDDSDTDRDIFGDDDDEED